MLVVKLELWPHGDKREARLLGQLIIANDCTGTAKVGNYTLSMATEDGGAEIGRVARHRRSTGAWTLVAKALRVLAREATP
jgi:hypothetical protein